GGNSNFHSVADDVEHATSAQARRLVFVDEEHRNIHGQAGVLAHAQEIHMHEEVAHRLKLVVLGDHAVLFAIHLDVDDGAEKAAIVNLAESVLVGHRNGQGGLLFTVDNGGNHTFTAQFTSGPLAHPIPHRSCKFD